MNPTLLRSGQFAALLVSGILACAANAQVPALNGKAIADALASPSDDAKELTRKFRPKANPDAATRVCDPQLNAALLRQTGTRGEELTRTLYVEAAPNVDLDIAFQLGEATLLPEGIRELDELATALRDRRLAGQRFVVAGHTDAQGGADYNDRLSCERALSARRYLQDKHGIDAQRLVPMGFGFTHLKDPKDKLSAVNRRVEIRRYSPVNP